jgi:FkbM family methyltransferase
MKAFGKYCFIILAGGAVGWVLMMVLTSLDARGRFILPRFYLRAASSWHGATGRDWPYLDKMAVLKPARVEVERGVNLFLDPGDLIGRAILTDGFWQPEVWQSISDGLSAGAVFFDVGAHIGYDSLKASVRVGESGKVISFEPNPRTLDQLRGNIAASHASNVIVEPIACTDIEQTLTLYDSTPEGNSGASSLALTNADELRRGILPSYSVRGRPIDHVVAELHLQRVDVIKVDVEGAEYLVLRGLRDTLARFHPKVVMEVVPFQLAAMHATTQDLVSLMNGLGYGPHKEVDATDWEWTFK